MSEPRRILFLVPYPFDRAPSQRLKFEQYLEHFRAAGFAIDFRPFYDEAAWQALYGRGGSVTGKLSAFLRGYLRRLRDLFRLHRYQVVFVHLWVTPIRPALFEWLVCRLARGKLIYDIDDLVYLKNAGHMSPWRSLFRSRRKPLLLMKQAEHVFTGTNYLDGFAASFNPNRSIIPVTIDTARYQPRAHGQQPGRPVVGWSGSRSTSPYLHLIREVLLEVHALHPFVLLVSGDAGFRIEGLDVEARDWTPAGELSLLARMDIGLYPLPMHDEWVLGKSGGKALQYMATGVPVLATAVGANFSIVQDGETGYLLQTKQEWKDRLLYLLRHPEERQRLGAAGRRRVEERYSVTANLGVYLDVLQAVARKR